VLFSDVSGYTAMTERLDPEEVSALMGHIKSEAIRIVEAHGGIVNQFVGDEVLALFGIPAAHEDDPVRAVRAAKELHRMVREMSPGVEERAGRPIRLHTGINTGLIVTSLRDQRDGMVGITGDAVNTGARLKALAEDDVVLLGPETQRLVADFFETEPLGATELKGKIDTVRPYRVLDEKRVATRFEAAAARGLTPYTGRERERSALNECLQRTIAGQGQFVTVMGEAGLGKSRLVYEVRHAIDRDKVTILEGRCQSYGATTPYLPFLDALRRGLRVHELTDTIALHHKVVENILAISSDLEPYLPHFLHLLSIPSETHPMPPDLQGDSLRRSFEEALAAIFTLNARRKPIMVILEDWHWADEASDSALRHLIGLIAGEPLQLVVLYRPEEYEPAWGRPRHLTPIDLAPLTPDDTAHMFRCVLGVDELPPGLMPRVHEVTGGNAFFDEEMALSLLEEGMVKVADGRATLTKPLDEIDLPNSVHAVIRSRLDRLDSDSQEALRVASVIGREFDREVLNHVYSAGMELAQCLDGLATQELVQQVRVVPRAEYIFKHVLTQVVVYETLLLQQRKTLHARVGHAIEVLYPDRLEEYYEDLAYHFRQSAETEKAIDYLGKSGDKAVSYSSLREARSHYQAAVEVLDSLNDREAYVDERIRITLRWAEIGTGLVTQELAAALAEAFACAQLLDQKAQMLELASWEAHIRMMLGEAVRGCELAEYVVSSPDATLGDAATGRAHACLAINAAWSGKAKSAADYARLGRQSLGSGMGPFWERWILMLNGLSGALCGEFDSLHWFEKAIGISSEERSMESWAPVFAGYAYNEQAAWAQASSSATLGREIAHRYDDPWPAAWGLVTIGYAEFMSGAKTGFSQLRDGVGELESIGMMLTISWAYAWLAEAMFVLNLTDKGMPLAEKSYAAMAEGDRVAEPMTLRALAMGVSQSDPVDWSKARSHLQNAIEVSNRTGRRPQAAHTHFRYAEILHKKGDLSEAHEQLDQAAALFRDMGQDWWIEQAEGLRGRIERAEPFRGFAPHVDGPPPLE
jgi:class 3 adenylate cyclase/tetratricopeptide (TPR) repeat protein